MRGDTKLNSGPRFERRDAADRRQQLIDAAIACLSEGGISAFTIDKISQRARVSRGLINHHFGSKDELLACVYEHMTNYITQALHHSLRPTEGPAGNRLRALIETSFEHTTVRRGQLRAWLALWGEVSTNQRLQIVHRKHYGEYQRQLALAIGQLAKERDRKVNAGRLATMLISVIDGLWLEWCLNPSILSERQSKQICYDLIASHLGSIKS